MEANPSRWSEAGRAQLLFGVGRGGGPLRSGAERLFGHAPGRQRLLCRQGRPGATRTVLFVRGALTMASLPDGPVVLGLPRNLISSLSLQPWGSQP